MKICSRCKINKELDCFNSHIENGKTRINSKCKECNIISSREYYEKNKEKISKERKDLYKSDENVRKAYSEYRNRQDVKDRKNKARREVSPENYYQRYKDHARNRCIQFDLDLDTFKKYWQTNCYYCGSKLDAVGFDRIDNNSIYTIDNIVPCCFDCNNIKKTKTQEEFYADVIMIYKNNNLGETK